MEILANSAVVYLKEGNTTLVAKNTGGNPQVRAAMRKLGAVAIIFVFLFARTASAEDFNGEAVALQQRGDWNGLRDLADRWTKAEPANAGAWTDLGVAYDRLGRPSDAVAAYERALALSPPNGSFQYMVSMALAADYHALHQPDKLKSLYLRVNASNPQYGAMLLSAYAADIQGPAGPPTIPAKIPKLALGALAEARMWQRDAALTMVQVWRYSGQPFDIAFTFVSAASRQYLTMRGSAVGGLVAQLAQDQVMPIPLPQRFLDLPEALGYARRVGLRGDLDHAILRVWRGPAGAKIAAWVIAPAHDYTFRLYNIDAVSGFSYQASYLFGPMPGNDKQLRDAIDQMRRAFAPPEQAASGTSWTPRSGFPSVGYNPEAAHQANIRNWQNEHYGEQVPEGVLHGP